MLRAAPSIVLLVSILVPALARADDVYWKTPDLLRDFFPRSERVTYVKVDTATFAGELAARLGRAPPKASYVVFVARTGDHVDGYAVIDDELGQHEPISFGVSIAPDGAVARVEVMVYREAYGGEVREPRFRRQFEGKTTKAPLRTGDDVIAISGATISAKSMATGVRRALALVAVVQAHALDTTTGSRPPAASVATAR